MRIDSCLHIANAFTTNLSKNTISSSSLEECKHLENFTSLSQTIVFFKAFFFYSSNHLTVRLVGVLTLMDDNTCHGAPLLKGSSHCVQECLFSQHIILSSARPPGSLRVTFWTLFESNMSTSQNSCKSSVCTYSFW